MLNQRNHDCKNVNEERYEQLRKEFIKVLIPCSEQRDPKSWPMAAARKTVDELMVAVKKFTTERVEK